MTLSIPTDYLKIEEIVAAMERFDAKRWTEELRASLEEIRKAALPVGAIDISHNTDLKIEETLVCCLNAANEARSASLDWLTITTTIESYKANLKSLDSEIEQIGNLRQQELDAIESSILQNIETTEQYASLETLRSLNLGQIVGEFYNQASQLISEQATKTAAHVSFRRDAVPGAPVPWVNAADPAFNHFEPGQPMFEQAASAQVWRQRHTDKMSEKQLNQHKSEVDVARLAVLSTIQSLKSQLRATDTQRHSAISRVIALRHQRALTNNRLMSTQIDWNSRAAGLLSRYSAAIRRLRIYAQALIRCLYNVYKWRFPTSSVLKFGKLVELESEGVGQNLDEIARFLGEVDAILRMERLASAEGSITVRVDLPLGGADLPLVIKPEDYPWASGALMRGLSCSVLGTASDLYSARIMLPVEGLINQLDENGTSKIRELVQKEIGAVNLSALPTRLAGQPEVVLAVGQCWNGSPFGKWFLNVMSVIGTKGNATVFLTIHFQYRRG